MKLKKFPDSRLKGLSIRNLKVIDSTTIQLFSEILRGVGRNRLDGARKKGGIKVHALIDAFSGVTEFIRITEARERDRKFLYHLKLVPNSWIGFDKAYTTYNQFAKWADLKIWFVTRERGNADFHVTKVLVDKTRQRKAKGVLKEQLVTVGVKQNFPLRYFWGESPNAIKIQVYCVLIAQLLMVVIRKKAATKNPLLI